MESEAISMQAVEIQKDIYWVGAIDWSLRSFHGYQTGRGATYNAYLILDDKITLIDTVKDTFADEMLERISSIIDPSKIDYIISSHVEPDHSGALPVLSKYAPHAKIITSLPNGLKGLKARYGELPYEGVKAGDQLDIGHRKLQFIPTPMLHWPDSMVTYCPDEKILFSNDAFGQHFASGQRFDEGNDLPTVLWEAKKYYANILMLYGRQAQAAIQALDDLDIQMIATGHGVIWRKHIPEIMACYRKWAACKVEERAVVVFDSMWHSTEKIARTIAEAFDQRGIPCSFYDIKENALSDIVTDILTSKYLAIGSPTINNQMMPTIASFLCYLTGLAPKNHVGFAFGSYGWGGQSIAQVEEAMKAAGIEILLKSIRIPNTPTAEQLNEITESIKNI